MRCCTLGRDKRRPRRPVDGSVHIELEGRAMPRISLVVLRCSSVEKALAFYLALGLEFVEERHGSGPVHYASEVGDTVLEIYPAAALVSVRHERVGFRVENLESVLAAVEQSGGSVESSSLHENVRRAVVVDPDGRKVELFES
jgi:lactoylglutathione lyase